MSSPTTRESRNLPLLSRQLRLLESRVRKQMRQSLKRIRATQSLAQPHNWKPSSGGESVRQRNAPQQEQKQRKIYKVPKTDTTKIPRPIKRGYRKTEYAENCSLCMYSHNGTCGFDYCHAAYSKALLLLTDI